MLSAFFIIAEVSMNALFKYKRHLNMGKDRIKLLICTNF